VPSICGRTVGLLCCQWPSLSKGRRMPGGACVCRGRATMGDEKEEEAEEEEEEEEASWLG
jgi:hypothetical protein